MKDVDHHATSEVPWWSSGRFEFATYRGRDLMVRHTGTYGVRQVCVGFIDGGFTGTRDNMPKICNLLFETVDRAS